MQIVIKGHKFRLIDIFGPLLAIAFGLLLLTAGIPLGEGVMRMDWPMVTGTILSSTVEGTTYPGSGYVHLSYEYSVNAKKYIGRYIYDRNEPVYAKEQADELVRTDYAAHNQVYVYYDPRHPEIACLSPGPHLILILPFGLGLLFFLGGCQFLYWNFDDIFQGEGQRVSVREHILAAITLEDENPREALKLYRQAKKQNEEFSVFIFIVSLFAPVLASVIMLRGFRDRRNGVVSLFSPEGSRGFWINAVVGGPFFLIRGAWLIVTAILFSLVVLSPFVVMLVLDARDGVINNPALTIGAYLFFPVFCIILLFLWADIRLNDLMPPRNIVNILFAAIRRNILEILENLSAIAAGCVIVSLQSNYATDILTPAGSAMIEGLLSGLFLAFALSRGDLSTDVNVFISLGMSRCHMHLQNWGSARILLRPVDADDICECVVPEDSKKLCEWLSGHLWTVIEGIRLRYQPHDLDRCIDRAKEIVESDVSDKEIWIKNIEANRLLVHGEVIRAALDRATKRRRWVKPIVLNPFWEDFLAKLFAIVFWVVVTIFFLRWLFRRLW